jgi:ADP-ribose pyrophosphatase YjhB (NUDIX family)
MACFKKARIRTAGAYVTVGGQYPFAIGRQPHQGHYPVFRLGGHVIDGESGWECAVREVAEEANIRIKPVLTDQTYLVSAADPDMALQEIEWEAEVPRDPKPLLVVAYDDIEKGPVLSLMYLAQSDEVPAPSGEVKGILMLDPESIELICRAPLILGQYLLGGGKAIFREAFDRNRTLEPFIQLRIFAQLLKQNLVKYSGAGEQGWPGPAR